MKRFSNASREQGRVQNSRQ